MAPTCPTRCATVVWPQVAAMATTFIRRKDILICNEMFPIGMHSNAQLMDSLCAQEIRQESNSDNAPLEQRQEYVKLSSFYIL